MIGAWIREELRSREPLVDMRMMAIRGVWTTNTVAFLIGVGMYSSFILLPRVRPGADQHRLRLRRLGDGRRPVPAPGDDRDHGRRPDGRGARAPHRLARRADRRDACSRSPRYALLVARPQRRGGRLRRRRPARHRDRACVLGDGQPDRRERAAGADRRRDRDERRHPDARRGLRRAAGGDAARGQPRRRRDPDRPRLRSRS